MTGNRITSYVPASPHLKTICSNRFENSWLKILVLTKPSIKKKYSSQDVHLLNYVQKKYICLTIDCAYVASNGRSQLPCLQTVVRKYSVHLELNDNPALTKWLVKPMQYFKKDASRGIRNSEASQLAGFMQHKINSVRKQPDTRGQWFWSFCVLIHTPLGTGYFHAKQLQSFSRWVVLVLTFSRLRRIVERIWSFWVLTCTPSTPNSGRWATKTLLILAMSSISFNCFRIIDISWRALLQWFPTGPQTWKFV